jgi:hypothetical protein
MSTLRKVTSARAKYSNTAQKIISQANKLSKKNAHLYKIILSYGSIDNYLKSLEYQFRTNFRNFKDDYTPKNLSIFTYVNDSRVSFPIVKKGKWNQVEYKRLKRVLKQVSKKYKMFSPEGNAFLYVPSNDTFLVYFINKKD